MSKALKLINRGLPLPSRMTTRSQVAAFSTNNITVSHDIENNRFLSEINNEYAVIDYDAAGKDITFLHTEVPEVFRGKGVAKLLAEEAFTYAVKNKLSVKIECDYLNNYFSKNKGKFKSLQIKV